MLGILLWGQKKTVLLVFHCLENDHSEAGPTLMKPFLILLYSSDYAQIQRIAAHLIAKGGPNIKLATFVEKNYVSVKITSKNGFFGVIRSALKCFEILL